MLAVPRPAHDRARPGCPRATAGRAPIAGVGEPDSRARWCGTPRVPAPTRPPWARPVRTAPHSGAGSRGTLRDVRGRRPRLRASRGSSTGPAGPASTCANPRLSAYAPSSANSSGVHQRTTGRCRVDGRRYWPRVRMSTPTPRRSVIAARSSPASSPMPRIRPDLVVRPASFARASTASDHAYPADGRAARWSRATVSRLWLRTSGRASKMTSSEGASPLQSGISTSTRVRGLRARTAAIVAAKPDTPPSSTSSRATLVTTTCSSPSVATASATRPGSSGSSASGLRVSTRQKPQARVHRSPRIMKVAVRSAQHS